jgi:hypothetical protein
MSCRFLRQVAAAVTGLTLLLPASPNAQSQPAPLRIVVIEGEDAVNVIQQKSAVSPVVEVRDRNDQPVAGAVVRFAVTKGRATFSGARMLTVTTDAAGRAAVTGLTPTGSGALQISASATFSGQTAATVTITQTNVATLAEASTAGAGSGGGIGAGTITAVGAGAAGAVGGLYAYKKHQEGDPPAFENFSMTPTVGLQNATAFLPSGNRSWHSASDGTDDAYVTYDYGDGQTRRVPVGPSTELTLESHVYTSAGTFTIRATITDHWGRTASAQATVTVVSLTGRWTSNASTGSYTFTQAGGSVGGTFTSAAGGQSQVSGTVAPQTVGGGAIGPGTVTLTLPTQVGPSVVVATFTGSMGSDPNQVSGSLVGPGISRSAVLTRQ